ncbi:MAG: hypothetical protein M3498_10650, partial [Deinococcota bacterium]|nr:hypothetical protein [Deinococcota bacterium]
MAPSQGTGLRRALPVLVMLFIVTLLGYPFALVLGLPLALRDMRDLRKWERETVVAQPPLDLSSPGQLRFPGAARRGVLIWEEAPLALDYVQE